LDGQIAETERELRAAVERRDRDTVADWLEARAVAIARAAPGYDASSSALIEAVTKSAAALPEASSLAADLEAMRREVGTAVELISTELRTAATRTRLGEAKIAFGASPEATTPSPPETGREVISEFSEDAASMSAGSPEQPDVSDEPESESGKPPPEQADSSSENFKAKTIERHAAA
jgi:hypothetical protein